MSPTFIRFGLGLLVLIACQSRAQSQNENHAKLKLDSDRRDFYGDPLPRGAIARIGTTRFRVPNYENSTRNFLPSRFVTLSPDGKAVAFVADSNRIDIWTLEPWALRRSYAIAAPNNESEPATLEEIHFSADGKSLLTIDVNRQEVLLIDLDTGKRKQIGLPIKGKLTNVFVQMARDRRTLVHAYPVKGWTTNRHEVLVWDLANSKLKRTLKVSPAGDDHVFSLSSDARWFVAAASAKYLEVWDLDQGKSVRKIDTDLPIKEIALSRDGKWLAATDGETVLRFYDFATGKEHQSIRFRPSRFEHLEFAPDGSLLLCSKNGNVSRWNPDNGEQIQNLVGKPNCVMRQFALRSDGTVIGLAVDGSALRVRDITSGKWLTPSETPAGSIGDLRFLSNTELSAADDANRLALWNPRTGTKIRELQLKPPFQDYGLLSMSPGGRFLVGGDMRIYDAQTGIDAYAFTRDLEFSALTFFDNDRKSAFVSNNKTRIWDTRTGRDMVRFDLPLKKKEIVTNLLSSANANRLAFATAIEATPHRCLLWDLNKNKLMREWEITGQLAISSDGNWLAFGNEPGHIRLCRAVSAASDCVLPLTTRDSNVTALAFSPDGRQLAGALFANTKSTTVFVIERSTKQVRLEFPNVATMQLAYSPDSGLLATGTGEATALIWQTGLREFARSTEKEKIAARHLNAIYERMAQTNAIEAFQAMIRLARAPEQTPALFAAKIPVSVKIDTGGRPISAWITDLGSSQFAVRTKATAILSQFGSEAVGNLRAALPMARDLETRRRIEAMLRRIDTDEWSANDVCHARAVEVLEAIATPEARELLALWASGYPTTVLTQEAARALKGMK